MIVDQCTGLMIENHLKTNASYPITYGTVITVECDPQYKLMGSHVITCEEGIVYSHLLSRPKCVNPGTLKYLFLLSMCVFCTNILIAFIRQV